MLGAGDLPRKRSTLEELRSKPADVTSRAICSSGWRGATEAVASLSWTTGRS